MQSDLHNICCQEQQETVGKMVPVNPSRTLDTNQAPTAVRVRENNESWGGGREAERLEHALVLSSSHLLVFKPRPTDRAGVGTVQSQGSPEALIPEKRHYSVCWADIAF